LNTLSLKLGGSAWGLYAERQGDPKFQTFSSAVFKRDDDRCTFCSFRASKHMMVVNLDHNYQNNKMQNLATACPFCQQCLFLEAAGKLQAGGGTMIYLPEMSQGQLNALCHVLYAAVINGSQFALKADGYIQALKLRASLVEKNYGKGMSNPSFMGQILLDSLLPDGDEKSAKILDNVRLLPSIEGFENMIVEWAGSAISVNE